ncbi:Stf0 family sulfotransferase [Roseibium marinum]|uniref:LPS sulfotransferase NodH n=1 Tax=Roseibium marinum TaxID=281252 RepID=A0A2S3UR45_9HYPH|nr:Stf0 family sulfotransferase [Roseibium marinum]POF30050.1 LPS sulfotransferase NodH [Roseibium marinum]
MSRYDSYVICTSPRSGSTLLCKLLLATGVAGNPGSYFHKASISDWLRSFELVPEETVGETETLDMVFRAAIAKGSLATGIFGLRLQRHSFDFFVRKLAVRHPDLATDRDRFQAAFGRTLFIHLTRTDKIEQAVSYVKAEQTGLWHKAPDGTELERLAPPRAPVYDADEIARCFERFAAFDLDWKNWFKTQGIEPLRITYEALSYDPSAALGEVLEALGLDRGHADGIAPGVAKLADETNQEWGARFRREKSPA